MNTFNINSFLKFFLTVISFGILLILTWSYFPNKQKILNEKEEQHDLLKIEFQEVLSQFIKNKHPEVSQVIFDNVWTQTTNVPSEVEIYFTYSLVYKGDLEGETKLKGSALLIFVENNLWQIKQFQTEQSHIQFSDPLIIEKALPDSNQE
ncbi:MAG: hypothetical protein GDA46_00825 [Bdellovibrionales bacterium]|nr:hypothetical protein [Bdellovibrionales bacterium]